MPSPAAARSRSASAAGAAVAVARRRPRPHPPVELPAARRAARPGPQHDRAPPGGSGGITPALDERALARARRADHGEQRLHAQPVDERLGRALAAEEQRGVLGGERAQAAIRRLLDRRRRPSSSTREQLAREPVPHAVVVVLEAVRQRDQRAPRARRPARRTEQLVGRARAPARRPATSGASCSTGAPSRSTSDRRAGAAAPARAIRGRRGAPRAHPELAAIGARRRGSSATTSAVVAPGSARAARSSARRARGEASAARAAQSRSAPRRRVVAVARRRGAGDHQARANGGDARRAHRLDQLRDRVRVARRGERPRPARGPARATRRRSSSRRCSSRSSATASGASPGPVPPRLRAASATGRATYCAIARTAVHSASRAWCGLRAASSAAIASAIGCGATPTLAAQRRRSSRGSAFAGQPDARRRAHAAANAERVASARAGRLASARANTASSAAGQRRPARAAAAPRGAQRASSPSVAAVERQLAGQRLVREDAERVESRARVDRCRIAPLLGRHVERRARSRASRVSRASRRRRVSRDPGRRRQLGDAEVEQLGQQPPGARQHHHVRRLEIAVDDALLVRGVDDLADALEQRHEPLERQRPLRCAASSSASGVPRTSSIAIHSSAVGLGAERIDVRGVRMIEPRRELRLAQEPLRPAPVAPPRVEHLDHRLAVERRAARRGRPHRRRPRRAARTTVKSPSRRPTKRAGSSAVTPVRASPGRRSSRRRRRGRARSG